MLRATTTFLAMAGLVAAASPALAEQIGLKCEYEYNNNEGGKGEAIQYFHIDTDFKTFHAGDGTLKNMHQITEKEFVFEHKKMTASDGRRHENYHSVNRFNGVYTFYGSWNENIYFRMAGVCTRIPYDPVTKRKF